LDKTEELYKTSYGMKGRVKRKAKGKPRETGGTGKKGNRPLITFHEGTKKMARKKRGEW